MAAGLLRNLSFVQLRPLVGAAPPVVPFLGADQPQDRGKDRMTNQQEEHPLSIGSAVQFTHKGKTIHGHLLQKQGRHRFAKVIDTEEQTWKIPESALKHWGGARLATIVTRHDKARADYRVGPPL